MKVSKLDIDRYIEIVNSLGVKFREINKTGYDSGYELVVPKGVRLTIPISLVFVSDKDEQKVYNRIIVEENAFAKVYTYCTSIHEGTHIGKTVGVVKGTLINAKIHRIDEKSELVSINRYKIEGGKFKNYLISGDSRGISKSDNIFKTINGCVEELILYKQIAGNFESKTRATLNNATAILKSKLIIHDALAKVYSLISGKGKGYSSCDAVITGKGRFITIPGLNAVKEGEYYHEASIGKIDREALLYLMSKGIDEETAKELYLRGFMLSDLEVEDERLKFLINTVFREIKV